MAGVFFGAAISSLNLKTALPVKTSPRSLSLGDMHVSERQGQVDRHVLIPAGTQQYPLVWRRCSFACARLRRQDRLMVHIFSDPGFCFTRLVSCLLTHPIKPLPFLYAAFYASSPPNYSPASSICHDSVLSCSICPSSSGSLHPMICLHLTTSPSLVRFLLQGFPFQSSPTALYGL